MKNRSSHSSLREETCLFFTCTVSIQLAAASYRAEASMALCTT